ncbi:hypothetical protein FRX31_029891 [Thalictrum thalictroides]|uniref:Uncharacterized protein n=1 Tax=Thalictrum thalictroides TaxID=46969 RepID=A0A7J6V8K3_THATH|nr:hypothetical protein FRX31_029891 [Thalictrum thalictroides]
MAIYSSPNQESNTWQRKLVEKPDASRLSTSRVLTTLEVMEEGKIQTESIPQQIKNGTNNNESFPFSVDISRYRRFLFPNKVVTPAKAVVQSVLVYMLKPRSSIQKYSEEQNIKMYRRVAAAEHMRFTSYIICGPLAAAPQWIAYRDEVLSVDIEQKRASLREKWWKYAVILVQYVVETKEGLVRTKRASLSCCNMLLVPGSLENWWLSMRRCPCFASHWTMTASPIFEFGEESSWNKLKWRSRIRFMNIVSEKQ